MPEGHENAGEANAEGPGDQEEDRVGTDGELSPPSQPLTAAELIINQNSSSRQNADELAANPYSSMTDSQNYPVSSDQEESKYSA